MSEKMRESLSALLDDEANELELERVLSKIADDAELRSTWARYHVARDGLTGNRLSHLEMDISVGVREAISKESAPGDSQSLPSLGQRMWRPVASFAVAASVAATVVIGGQQLAQISTSDPYAGPLVASGVSSVGMVNSLGATSVRASYGTEAIPVLEPATRKAYRRLADQRMRRYMQEHAEHAALNSPQGLIPFARVQDIRE